MTRDEIIRMAREAGLSPTASRSNMLAMFAALVAAAERAACAECVEKMDVQHPKHIAAAIRARGQQ